MFVTWSEKLFNKIEHGTMYKNHSQTLWFVCALIVHMKLFTSVTKINTNTIANKQFLALNESTRLSF